MRDLAAKKSLFFLYRADAGEIDAKTWIQGTLMLGGLLAVLTAGWIVLSPYAYHDLNVTPFFAVNTFIAYLYLLFYAFAVLLIAISHYNLSAKRWRARGWPSSLAGLLPLLALFAAAAQWLQPRAPLDIASWQVAGIDILLAGVIVWNIVELGLRPFRSPAGSSAA
jgi:uncharacterized membrane protein YhaH (DUF805 family)